MRTTLDIDEQVLLTVKQIARERNSTTGAVVSGLLRDALQPVDFQVTYRNGIPVLPRRPNGPVVTPELVNSLLDEDDE